MCVCQKFRTRVKREGVEHGYKRATREMLVVMELSCVLTVAMNI